MKGPQVKEEVKERYGKIAIAGKSSEGCCASSECCTPGSETSLIQIAKNIGYDPKELECIPESSILGVGCGAPINFANIHEGEVVVDIGSGGGIDVFLAANKVKGFGKVIGIDMTDEMLERARNNAKRGGFINVEFKKGDIERGVPIEDNTADIVISNCVINLTLDKVAAFNEIYRILRSNGRMVISDLVTRKQVGLDSANSEDWCSCIDGALTKENYIDSIRKAGFDNIMVLQETPYIEEDKADSRTITSVVIKAVK
jgi:arsenite methyltransferase